MHSCKEVHLAIVAFPDFAGLHYTNVHNDEDTLMT